MHAARALRVDLRARPELAFLAELALCLPLPAGWEPIPGGSSYRNSITKVTVASHPPPGPHSRYNASRSLLSSAGHT